MPGGPTAPSASRFSLAGLRLSGSSLTRKRSVKLSYTLSSEAKVRLVVALATRGRAAKGTCVTATARSRRGRACVRYVTKATLTLPGKAGANTTVLAAKLGAKTLPPGATG